MELLFDVIARIGARFAVPAVSLCPFEAVADDLRDCRAAARLPQAAKTVICFLFPYRMEDDRPRNLSRYACVPDYHQAAGAVLTEIAKELKAACPACSFVPFIDNSPIPEVLAAAKAGLGVLGDNGLLIAPRFGSWVFIGTIVTDADCGAAEQPVARCLHCGACRAACPSGCIGADRTACLSRLSQKKGALSDEEQERLKQSGVLWGCDKCQEVCPMNAASVCAPHPCFDSYEPLLTAEGLSDLEGKAYGWRGEAVLRRNLEIFNKNGESE